MANNLLDGLDGLYELRAYNLEEIEQLRARTDATIAEMINNRKDERIKNRHILYNVYSITPDNIHNITLDYISKLSPATITDLELNLNIYIRKLREELVLLKNDNKRNENSTPIHYTECWIKKAYDKLNLIYLINKKIESIVKGISNREFVAISVRNKTGSELKDIALMTDSDSLIERNLFF
ncbi:MAG: hypothetical protein WCT77_01615 [Bacteroidota bacterium]